MVEGEEEGKGRGGRVSHNDDHGIFPLKQEN
jgi:hypothetical protein